MKWANLHVNIPRVVAYRPVFDAMDVQTASMDLMKVDAVSKNNLSNKLIIGFIIIICKTNQKWDLLSVSK